MKTALVFSMLLVLGCAADLDTEPQDECSALAGAVADCGGEVPGNFVEECQENPEGADNLAAALCATDTDDGLVGWVEPGDRCFNFNFECAGADYVCRPTGDFEGDQVCERRATGSRSDQLCDDDDDCVEGLLCLGEDIYTAGACR